MTTNPTTSQPLTPPARPMTVVQLLPSMRGGGVERGVVEVSQALVEAGHTSIVVSAGGPMVDELTAHGAEHVAMPIGSKSLKVLGCLRPLKQLVADRRVDILHARSRLPAWVSYVAWKQIEKKRLGQLAYLTSVHGLNSVSGYSRVMTFGQEVECVSETVRDYVLKHYPQTDASKLTVIHRGVDPAAFVYGYKPSDEWLKDWHTQFPELAGKFVVTVAGRLTRLKGHHDLFQAIDGLKKLGIPAHGLVVGGEDPRRQGYAQEIKQAVQTMGLSNDITFTGHRSDIRQVMAVSGAVLSLSTKPESFGRSVLEAVRLGTPVVGYNHGGVGEVLGAIYPQGLVPLSDIEALVQALAQVARGEVAKPEPTDRFLLSDMLDKTLAMYGRAAAKLAAGQG